MWVTIHIISLTMRHTRPALEYLKSMRYKAMITYVHVEYFQHLLTLISLQNCMTFLFCGTQKKIFWKTFIVWTEKHWNVFHKHLLCSTEERKSWRFLGKLYALSKSQLHCCLRDTIEISEPMWSHLWLFCHMSMARERTKNSSVHLGCPTWVSMTPDVMPQNQSQCQSPSTPEELCRTRYYPVYGLRTRNFSSTHLYCSPDRTPAIHTRTHRIVPATCQRCRESLEMNS